MIAAVFFGAIGAGYFVYGKRQKHLPTLLSAIGLFVAPYFTANFYILILVGIILIVIPFFVDY